MTIFFKVYVQLLLKFTAIVQILRSAVEQVLSFYKSYYMFFKRLTHVTSTLDA